MLKKHWKFGVGLFLILCIFIIWRFSYKLVIEDVLIENFNALSDTSIVGLGSKERNYRFSAFLVTNFLSRKIDYKIIDSVACFEYNKLIELPSNTETISVVFYKKTSVTNNEFIRENPRKFYQVSSEDKLFRYYWTKSTGTRIDYSKSRESPTYEWIYCPR